MDQWHAHCSLRPLAALLIMFIFFIGLSRNLVQAESLLNALSLFAALTSSKLFMDVNRNDNNVQNTVIYSFWVCNLAFENFAVGLIILAMSENIQTHLLL